MKDKKEAPSDLRQSSGAIENYPLKDNNFDDILQADFQDNLEVLKANKEIPQQITAEPFSSSDATHISATRHITKSLILRNFWIVTIAKQKSHE